MGLEEYLKQPSAGVAPSGKAKDWQFTQEYAPHDHESRSIVATSGSPLETEDDWTRFVEERGGKIAPGYRVRLVEMRHNTHGWTRAGQGEDATTTGTWFYRFAVEPDGSTVRMDDILALIGKRKARPSTVATGVGVFETLVGDLQLGKIDGDGVDGTIDAFEASIHRAVLDFKEKRRRHSIGLVHIPFLGDCIEGNQSQNGKNMWRTSLTVTEQTRLFRRLMLHAIDSFAPLVERVEVDVVNGNHDQVQRFQETRADDGHATEAAIALADGLVLNPSAYGHVGVFVPERDSWDITREVGSSVITMAHGHMWARGKAMEWWKGMTFNGHLPGHSQFLFHGHEHEFSVQSKKDRVVFCVPPFESESRWWMNKTGDRSMRGAITMVTNGGTFSDVSVV